MEDPKIVFEKLTPFTESDIQIYEAAIDRIFEEADVRNVAISGAYGSGKSSVLESYKKKHGNLKFVHISLAHFQNPNEENTTVSESVLEGKILNQLIHQISAERIPQTNFRVKTSVKTSNVLLMAGAIAFCILAALNILYFDAWRTYIGALPLEWVRKIFAISTNIYSPLIFGSIGFLLICCFLYKIIRLQKTKSIFKKLNFQGNEIEIFEQTDDSFFDKYLNEVLYLFENVDADVIVFEDMDRFEANRIFERLREVNTLVNQQPRKNNEKVLRFFYLLRDDIFVSKDRTKFFDYIIPIVPVMDGSNSYNQFISHLKKNNLFDRFDEHFLQGISLYVDDMRLLKNICNEFLVYYYRLNTTELDFNKMLAIIVYKNLFPRDFCELQLGKGFVYAIFASKDHFISSEQKLLEEKILSLAVEIDQCQKEHLETIQELDDAYDQKRRRVTPYYSQQRTQELKELEESYAIRKRAIENKKPGDLEKLISQKAALEQKLAMLQNCPLKGIITRENIDDKIIIHPHFHKVFRYFFLI